MGSNKAVAILLSVGLAGCAGTLSQFTDPAISSDHLDEPTELSKLKALSGDRRLVRVGVDNPPSPYRTYIVCAETHADAIAARSAGSTVTVRTGDSLSDMTAQELLLTNSRTAVSDVVRQVGWQLCNARMNGDLSPDEYAQALLELSRGAIAVLLKDQSYLKADKLTTSSASADVKADLQSDRAKAAEMVQKKEQERRAKEQAAATAGTPEKPN